MYPWIRISLQLVLSHDFRIRLDEHRITEIHRLVDLQEQDQFFNQHLNERNR